MAKVCTSNVEIKTESPDCSHLFEYDAKKQDALYLDTTKRLPHVYNQMRLEKELVDVFFTIGATVFPAHRNIMTAEMKFFKNYLKNKDSEMIPLDETGIDENVFEYVIEYAYLGKLRLNSKNWDPLYRAAVYMDSGDMKVSIERYLCEHIDKETFFTVWDFGEEFDLKILPGKLIEFMLEHYEEFTALDENQTVVKLSNAINLEERRYFDAIKWVKFDSDQALKRRTRLHIFLRAIPLESLSTEFLNTEVAGTSLMSECCKCLKLFIEACFVAGRVTYGPPQLSPLPPKNAKIEEVVEAKIEEVFQTKTEEVVETKTEEVDQAKIEEDVDIVPERIEPIRKVFNFSGSTDTEQNSIMRWRPLTDNWMRLESSRNSCSMVYMNGSVYVAGGRKGVDVLNTLSCYRIDYEFPNRNSCAQMKHARYNCGIAHLNGKLYVCGGKDHQNKRTSTFERYNPDTDRWEELAPMNKKRSKFELVAFEDSLYAIGGLEKCSCNCATAERYNVQTNTWTNIATTKQRKICRGSAVLERRIYVCGNKLEVFAPEFGTWKTLADAPTKNENARLELINGRLLFMNSSHNHETSKYSIEIYEFSIATRKWTLVPDSRQIFQY